jgi:hypothetical protein
MKRKHLDQITLIASHKNAKEISIIRDYPTEIPGGSHWSLSGAWIKMKFILQVQKEML